MLEFYASRYLDIVHRFGLLLGSGKPPDPDVTKDVWAGLAEEAEHIGLPVTKEYLHRLTLEVVDKNPGCFKLTASGGYEIIGAKLTHERSAHYAEAIYETLRAELGSLKLRVIPREKAGYCDPKWLTEGLLMSKYSDTVDEFQRAGRCFAYGENTACVFHLMRVTDFYLRRVADSLNVLYDSRNWQGIADKISKAMEQKYQNKTSDWKKAEPFYAEILTDIQAIGRGHRNPALHELEKKYDEREARYMLTVIESFADHVARQL